MKLETQNTFICKKCEIPFNTGARMPVMVSCCDECFCKTCWQRAFEQGEFKCPDKCGLGNTENPQQPRVVKIILKGVQENDVDVTCDYHGRPVTFYAKDLEIFKCSQCYQSDDANNIPLKDGTFRAYGRKLLDALVAKQKQIHECIDLLRASLEDGFTLNAQTYLRVVNQSALLVSDVLSDQDKKSLVILETLGSNFKLTNQAPILTKQEKEQLPLSRLFPLWKEEENKAVQEGLKFEVKQYQNSIYLGYFKGEVPHGPGVESNNDGSVFQGMMANGRRNGFGVAHFVSENTFEGYWKENKRNGKGCFTWKDGTKYVGDWENDYKNGQGVIHWFGGEKYSGTWKNGVRDGYGVVVCPNGRIYAGNWVNGVYKDERKVVHPIEKVQPRREQISLEMDGKEFGKGSR